MWEPGAGKSTTGQGSISHFSKMTSDSNADGLFRFLYRTIFVYNCYSEAIWGYTVDIHSTGRKTDTETNFRVRRKSNMLLDNSNTVNAWHNRQHQNTTVLLQKCGGKSIKLTFVQTNRVQTTWDIKSIKKRTAAWEIVVQCFKTLTKIPFVNNLYNTVVNLK